VRWLEESNRAYAVGRFDTNTDLVNGPLLALAQKKAGHVPEARDLMRRVQQAVQRLEAARTDGAISIASTDWLPLQILMPEAEGVVLYDPVFPAQPFAVAP
jgi:hypothetical protein